ncbi:MAG: M4 family metallopeptidase [Saprospiraceae bacterium]|nr:M4 family metallopeptidase [Saprospiraceae bacterium]
MKKLTLLFVLFLAVAKTLSAQSAKIQPPKPPSADHPAKQPQAIQWNRPGVPLAENPFGLPTMKYEPKTALQPITEAPAANLRIQRGENGLPIWIQGKTAASGSAVESKPIAERAVDYVASLQLNGIQQAGAEFKVSRVQTDEQGQQHIRLTQQYQGVPVYGAEVIAHTRNGAFESLNGRYYPTPSDISIVPTWSAAQVIEKVQQEIGLDRIKTNWSDRDRAIIGGQPFTAELIIYHPERNLNGERLAYRVQAHPNLMSRLVYFMDANTGEVLYQYNHTCNASGKSCSGHHTAPENDEFAPKTAAEMPPVPGSGPDLLGVTRQFGTWQDGSTYYLLDASRQMFNGPASTMPNDPVGAIVTFDALNTSPEVQQTFNYDFVKAGSANFNYPAAISAHYNAIESYEYFRGTHGRKSIDGQGGNIISFINVTEADGSSMENAFWNGNAMWYGNGGPTFKRLARGLDVGAHEMTHGVIESTANLEYQYESGALNESFADIFAVMVDEGDWLIGEDVMQPGQNPNNALRSLQDPHNGVSSSSTWYQPKHTNEQYNGNDDNGGVHINSGITNHAFYLFATNAAVGNDKAEKVYYKALNDYLVKSSQFVDCRLAVIQAATELYGQSVANAAAAAFTAVGINGSEPGGNYLGQLSPNPGTDLIFAVTNDQQRIDMFNGAGNQIISIWNQGVKSRPSVSDDGRSMVFVSEEGHIVGIDFNYAQTPIQFAASVLTLDPEWRNAAISKDGRFIAGIRTTEEPVIWVFDLLPPFDFQGFQLYNPTYSQNPTNTGEVRFADVLEFDYSGNYVMYDAYNELNNGSTDLSYWDISFLEFYKNGEFAPANDAFISKLVSGLPENTSIGDPTFSKNSPYILAFDYIDNAANRNHIIGFNAETGDNGTILLDNGALGWPSFNRLDNAVIFESPDFQGDLDIYRISLASNKITASGQPQFFITSRNWGVWYANGSRSLELSGTTTPQGNLKDIAIAPNPTSDWTQLRIKADVAADARVTVVDLLGKTLMEKSISLTSGENNLDISLVDLPAGQYLLRVVTEKGDAAVLQAVKY